MQLDIRRSMGDMGAIAQATSRVAPGTMEPCSPPRGTWKMARDRTLDHLSEAA